MSRDQTKTDHSHFDEKLKLRIENLPKSNPLKVLDLFSGNGQLWEEIQKRTGREILTLRIDKEKGKRGIYLMGDNRKFKLDFAQFDIVDLDAYGIPFYQLERVLSGPSRPKRIFITFIQSQFGRIPRGMLQALGYSDAMVKKIPTLFDKEGREKLLRYLAGKGIKSCKVYSSADGHKNYISI